MSDIIIRVGSAPIRMNIEEVSIRMEVTAAQGPALGGVSDHGALTGLADDDHPQYAKISLSLDQFANVTMSGTLALTGTTIINGGTHSGNNSGDNAANTTYASDYRAANFVAGTNYLAPTGSAAGLTSFPTLNQNTTGTAASLSSVLVSTLGGSGVNNAGTLTWGAGGTLGTAAYTASSAYATSAQGTLANTAVQPAALASYVLYTGATGPVDLGAQTLTAGQLLIGASGVDRAILVSAASISDRTFTFPDLPSDTVALMSNVTDVQNLLANYLLLSGASAMTGPLDMGTFAITNASISGSLIGSGTVAADWLGSGGGAGKFLRYDNTWQTISAGATNLGYTASTRILTSDTGTDVTLPLVTSTDAGLAPLSGGGTANFLRADGTWAAPSSGATNLTYTASTRVVASDTGTDATLTLADGTNAGLMTSADFTKLGGIAAGAQVNVATDLSYTAASRLLASSTGTDATLPLVTSTDAGLAPLSGGGTANFLRADATWAAPPSGATNLTYTAATRIVASDTGTDATLPLFTSTDPGLVPLSGGGTSNFLRADGAFAAPSFQPLDADLTALAGISGVRGDVIFYGATGWERLGFGTSGNLLQTNGSGADPTWAPPPAGSGFTTLISGNSGTANATAAPQQTWQTLTGAAASNSTVTIATVMTTNTLPAGTYRYRYDIVTLSAATTTAQKFSVNATGTVTKHLYHLFFPSQGVSAATGVVDQDINVTTGAVWAHLSTRTNNTTLGPLTDHDTTGEVHYVIEGILVTTTSGNLLLGHASEVAFSSTVQAGTTLVLERLN